MGYGGLLGNSSLLLFWYSYYITTKFKIRGAA